MITITNTNISKKKKKYNDKEILYLKSVTLQ